MAETVEEDAICDKVWIRGIADLEQRFLADRELVAMACVLSTARRLVMGGVVPRSLRQDLALVIGELGLLLSTSHLRARSGVSL